MSMNLIAKFKMTAERLDALMVALDQRTSHHHKVDAENLANEPGYCMVGGAPQDVMFVIGEVAAQGEDCLIFAAAIPEGVSA